MFFLLFVSIAGRIGKKRRVRAGLLCGGQVIVYPRRTVGAVAA